MIIAGLILLGTGFLFCILGIIFFVLGRKNNRSAQAEGKIVDMCYNSYMYNKGGNSNVKGVISFGSQSAISSCPVFEYKVDGLIYKRAGKVAYNRGRVMRMIGQPCRVYYNPNNPEDVSLSSKSPLLVLGIVFSLISVVVLILGIVFLVIGH